MHYFDHAAATPLSDVALKAMQPYLQTQFYNPSALYLAAQDVKKAVEQARADVAGVLGVKASEIIFTAGGTEADNLAIAGVMRKFPEANCIVSAIEHEAILEIAQTFDHKIASVKPDGRVDLDVLKSLIDDDTVLVSLMYANNEIGTVQPLASVAKLLHEIKAQRTREGNKLPLYFHTDASQAPNYLHVLVNTLGVDLMSLNAGKIYGPKETGALYVKTGVELEPLIRGGGQERGMRSGTQNVANIVGFAAALKEAAQLRETESERLKELQQKTLKIITELFPGANINGSTEFRLPNNIHLTIPGADNERLMMELDEQGFMVATGSACSASSDEPSHVLRAVGLSDQDARSSLRITMGRDTTEESLTNLLKTLKNLV
jgi:cysteine desulfurase